MLKSRKGIRLSAPDSMISEQFRDIRTNIHFSSVDHKIQTLLVTSPGYAEGKSTISIHLAASIAQQGDRVLVVDTDLRDPSLHHVFKMNQEIGLTNVLNGGTTLEEAVKQTEVERVFLLTSGSTPFNPAELIGSHFMKKFMENAKEQFDVILFDSPPVLEVTDSRILASMCDGVILVLLSGKTKEEAVIEAKRLLDFARANVLGLVFNQKK
jgi:protein-tyrosine kinase